MGETFSLKMSNPFCTSKKVNGSKLEVTFINEKKMKKSNFMKKKTTKKQVLRDGRFSNVKGFKRCALNR